MKHKAEQFSAEPPPDSPEDKWWEEPKRKEPYNFGEVVDLNNPDKSYLLCPICGREGKLQPEPMELPVKMAFKCSKNHWWSYNSETEKIENFGNHQEGFEFSGK